MDCLFCSIIQGNIPASIVFDNERVLAFKDINPQAPTHVLVIPKKHVENAAELALQDSDVLSELFSVARDIAEENGLNCYRTVFNTGVDGGQTVFHAHLHLLGGRSLQWPPG